MKQILHALGTGIFWVAWPVWYVYFRLYPLRSRVLVVCGDEVLLIKAWLSNNKWMLPGGGANRNEEAAASAVRELYEEVGVITAETALRPLGSYAHTGYKLRYNAAYFVLELEEKPQLKKRFFEISDAGWHKLSDIRGRMLDEDAAYALKQYVPLDQTSLL